MDAFMDFLKLIITTPWGVTILAVLGLCLIVLLYRPIFKAVFDCLFSLIGMILLSPVFLIISILVKKSSPGPVFFRQKRVGKNKKLFTIHKFRTMRIDTPKDCPTHMLSNTDTYITKIGKFLRKTSLDEIPQIWDIFRLKMSIIGPRPALYNQDDLVAERDKYAANNIRPGLTGLAQVSGRDELEIPIKAELDGQYKKKRNIFLDIKIFFLTIFKVFKSDGVKEGGTGAIKEEYSKSIESTANNFETGDLPVEDDENYGSDTNIVDVTLEVAAIQDNFETNDKSADSISIDIELEDTENEVENSEVEQIVLQK